VSPEDEAAWLRARVIRLRVALRFTKDPRVEMILREVIADAEDRLASLDPPPIRRPRPRRRETFSVRQPRLPSSTPVAVVSRPLLAFHAAKLEGAAAAGDADRGAVAKLRTERSRFRVIRPVWRPTIVADREEVPNDEPE
jgi:hypothetical protein